MTDSELDPARWARVVGLFEAAAELAEGERTAWLEAQAADDPAVHAVVRRMLDADRSAAGLLSAGIAQSAHLALGTEPTVAPGTRVGAFDVVGELGRGGSGVVYEAVDRHLGRAAALKFLPDMRGRADADRLIDEARTAAALDHPNVAAIYQIGETDDGRRFIAMPRYEGETLASRIAKGPVPVTDALAIARQVASALAAAHRAGIVHRDVTPSNVFLTRDGPVKLLDFGIAALHGTRDEPGVARGTISSMSPEQARGEPADPRSDVWSLGVLLYRMLIGEAPFADPSPVRVIARIRSPERAPRIAGRRDVPRRLARIVERALEKQPHLRYADAGDMLASLDRVDRPARRVTPTVIAALLLVALATAAWLQTATSGAASAGEARRVYLTLRPTDAEGVDSAVAELATNVVRDAARRLMIHGRVHVVDGSAVAAGARRNGTPYELVTRLVGAAAGPSFEARLHDERGGVVWSEGRPFDPSSVRELSSNLTTGVLDAVGIALTQRERASLAGEFPASVAAYRSLVTGNGLLVQRTPGSLLAAMARYRDALETDPGYVAAMARLAYANLLLIEWGWRHPTRHRAVLLEESDTLIRGALARDSASAEAWLARGYLLVLRDPHRLAGAADAFRRAIALDPYNAEVYHQYGQAAMVLGRYGEAATAYRRALELQPDYAMTLVALAGVADIRGRRAEAIRLIDRAIAAAPEVSYARAMRSLLHTWGGDYTAARAEAATALQLDESYEVPALAAMASAYGAAGDTAAGRLWLDRALAAASDTAAPSADEAYLLATALLHLGRDAEAARLVERVEPRGASLWHLLQLPNVAPLRARSDVARVLAEADPR